MTDLPGLHRNTRTLADALREMADVLDKLDATPIAPVQLTIKIMAPAASADASERCETVRLLCRAITGADPVPERVGIGRMVYGEPAGLDGRRDVRVSILTSITAL